MKLQTIDIKDAAFAIVPLKDYDCLHEALEERGGRRGVATRPRRPLRHSADDRVAR